MNVADMQRFDEDLRRIAPENFAIANHLCRSWCGQMHALWPYIRLARASTGVETASSPVYRVLRQLIADRRPAVLIAGAADTGLLGLVARASGPHPCEIVVLDRCETPIESCNRLARSWSLPVGTMHADLTRLDVRARFDLVLVHGTLHHIAAKQRVDVLGRLARALRPAGRMVLLFNTSQGIEGPLAPENRNGYPDWVLGELDRVGIALPEEREAFRARLRVHAELREAREGAFNSPAIVHAMFAGAGFNLLDCFEIAVTLASPVENFTSKICKRRFLAIAE